MASDNESSCRVCTVTLASVEAEKSSERVTVSKRNNGRTAGHDSLEDAFATREVVCWWLKMIPDQ